MWITFLESWGSKMTQYVSTEWDSSALKIEVYKRENRTFVELTILQPARGLGDQFTPAASASIKLSEEGVKALWDAFP